MFFLIGLLVQFNFGMDFFVFVGYIPMGLFEKSEENKRIAMKCLDMKAFNAGISRAYYATFQRVEYILKNNSIFNYGAFLIENQINGDHIPHGKMQQAMVQFILESNEKVNLGDANVYDNLYRKRRLADYADQMFNEQDLKQSINDMETILRIIVQGDKHGFEQ